MPLQLYQFGIPPPNSAADKQHSHRPIFGANLMGSPFYSFGGPVEIRKATTAPVQRDSAVHKTNEDFIIQLELRDYQPDEINVTSDDHQVTITAKHELLHSTNGCVSRAVTHVYKLPEDVHAQSLTAAMNSQGILIIRATRSTVKSPPHTV